MITKGQSDCWNTSVTKWCLFAVSLKFPYEHSIMLCKTLTSQYLFKQEIVIGYVGAAFKQGFVYFNMLFLVIYGIIGILIYQIIKLNSWYFCSKVHKCHSPSLTQICLWVIIKEFKVRLKVMMPFEELSASKKVLQQVIYLKSSELKFLLKKKFSFKVKRKLGGVAISYFLSSCGHWHGKRPIYISVLQHSFWVAFFAQICELLYLR